MDPLVFYIGVLGNIISVLVFASPIETFWRITKSKSTEDFEPTPYVVTLLSSSLWVYYGLTKPDAFLVATVNCVGVVLETIYVVIFLLYAKPNLRAKTARLVGLLDVGLFGLVFFVTWFFMTGNLRIVAVGTICACLNIFMYGSPLLVMKTVINTRSVEYMPFFLSFFLFLNGGIWTAYAILQKDIFLGIPNGIGFIFGSAQLVIYRIFINCQESKLLRERNGEYEYLQEPLARSENIEERIRHVDEV